MKLAFFERPDRHTQLGIVTGDTVTFFRLPAKHGKTRIYKSIIQLIKEGTEHRDEFASFARPYLEGNYSESIPSWKLSDVEFFPPVMPASLRDFYAFEQHVKTANHNRGREVPKEWYEFPVFYFCNHTEIFGHEDVIPCPAGSDALDYELEVACVIGKTGKNIPAEKAEDYIFGYMIYNDWSARDIQRKEMAVGLGPAKSKDFAQSFGPYLVTPDELADRHTGRPGVYNLEMVARVNGVERSRGNWQDLYWSFGQMIERASQGVTLQPGDVIGSGTVGTGCLLETTKGQGPWLQPGDVVELEIERLGVLRNVVGAKSN